MNKKVMFGSACVAIVALGAVAYNMSSEPKTSGAVAVTDKQILAYTSESTLQTVESSASFGKLYHDDKEMFKDADLVALVKVDEQEVVNHSESLVTTKSTVSVEQLIKGDAPATLTISELGGVVDFSKIPDIGKPSDGKALQKGIVETTIEGSPVMKKDHTYFVILKQNPDAQWGYNILGSVQGKIRFDVDKNMTVTTVDNKSFKEDLFFLQKEHAGKTQKDMLQYLKSLK